MRFKTAVQETPDVKNAWCKGLNALGGVDKKHIEAPDPRRLRGSVAVDAVLKDKYPNDPRWDYAIGYQPKNDNHEVVYWVEVHPATAGEIKVVLAKLQWLKNWLRQSADKLDSLPKEFIWVSSSKTSFTLTSPQQKQFALLGLQHKGRVFTISS